MAATRWLLLICLAAAGVLQARAQPDSIGFISIDCGLPGTASYVDDTTKLSYAPDAAFTHAGSNHNISAEYLTPNGEEPPIPNRVMLSAERRAFLSSESGCVPTPRPEHVVGKR
jgi:hypothetical protein